MRAVVTREGGGLILAEHPRPEAPPGGGLVRVSLCGLCGSDLEKFTGPTTAAGAVLGHEVVGRLERPGEVSVRVALAHHVPCGVCELCRSGHSSLCARFRETNLDPGGFAEELAVSAEHLTDAVFPLPAEIDDLTATLLEPLSCVLRAVEAAAGLLGAFPPPDVHGVAAAGGAAAAGAAAVAVAEGGGVVGVGRAGSAAGPPTVLVAGCGSVGLLFLSVLAAAREGVRAPWAPVAPGALLFLEPHPERAALAQGLGARAMPSLAAVPSPTGPTSGHPAAAEETALPPRLAFVTALPALRAVVRAMAPGGVAVVFAGGSRPAPLDLDLVYRRELTLAGVRSGSPRHLRQALAALTSGSLRLGWYRPEVVDLAGLPGAATRYAQGEVLKVVARV